MTGAPGIYYSDFPDLSGFSYPEWSHLSLGDSVEFSKRLVPHLRDALNMQVPIASSIYANAKKNLICLVRPEELNEGANVRIQKQFLRKSVDAFQRV